VPRGSSPWRWVVVAWLAATVLVIGGTVAGLNWFITEVGVDHPIHIVIHGEEVVRVEHWRELSSGELLLVASALLLAFLAVVIVVPAAVLLGLAAAALGVLVGLTVPLLVLAVLLAVFLSPLILLVWIVMKLLA
jgi:hypothetical protein